MKILFFFVAFIGVSFGEIKFLRKVDEASWSIPISFIGKSKIGDGFGVSISVTQDVILVKTTDSGVLFEKKGVIASKPLLSNGILAVPLFRKVGPGFVFYAFLLCEKTKSGIMGRLIELNLSGEERESIDGSYYILGSANEFDYPNFKVYAVLLDKDREEDVWIADINLSPSPTDK